MGVDWPDFRHVGYKMEVSAMYYICTYLFFYFAWFLLCLAELIIS